MAFTAYAGQPRIVVALDNKFEHILNGKGRFGTITYLISEAVRNDTANYKDKIYIAVSSNWNADYYFYT